MTAPVQPTRIALRCACGDSMSFEVRPERPSERIVANYRVRHTGDRCRVRGAYYPPRRPKREATWALGTFPRRRSGLRDL